MPPSSTPGSVTRGPRAVPVGGGKRQFFKKVASPTTVCLFMPPLCNNLIEPTWRKGEKRAYGPQCMCNEWKIKLSRELSTLVARAFTAPETFLVQMVSYCLYSNN